MSPVRCVQMHYITPQKGREAFQRNYYLASAYPEHSLAVTIMSLRLSIFSRFMGELVYKEASVSSVRHTMIRSRVLQPAHGLEGMLS